MIRQADLVDASAVDRRADGMRAVTSARASIDAARRSMIVTQSPCVDADLAPPARARSRQKSSGCSSARCESVRDMPPAVWCSVSRYVVSTYGKRAIAATRRTVVGPLLPIAPRDWSAARIERIARRAIPAARSASAADRPSGPLAPRASPAVGMHDERRVAGERLVAASRPVAGR